MKRVQRVEVVRLTGRGYSVLEGSIGIVTKSTPGGIWVDWADRCHGSGPIPHGDFETVGEVGVDVSDLFAEIEGLKGDLAAADDRAGQMDKVWRVEQERADGHHERIAELEERVEHLKRYGDGQHYRAEGEARRVEEVEENLARVVEDADGARAHSDRCERRNRELHDALTAERFEVTKLRAGAEQSRERGDALAQDLAWARDEWRVAVETNDRLAKESAERERAAQAYLDQLTEERRDFASYCSRTERWHPQDLDHVADVEAALRGLECAARLYQKRATSEWHWSERNLRDALDRAERVLKKAESRAPSPGDPVRPGTKWARKRDGRVFTVDFVKGGRVYFKPGAWLYNAGLDEWHDRFEPEEEA